MAQDAQHPKAERFSQQLRRTPPPVAHGEDYDPAETVIRKAPPRAIGAAADASPHADKFADQMRTTMRRKALAPPPSGIPRCLRLLPPSLLEQWIEHKPRLLQRLQEELEQGELKVAHEILQELLYDHPRVEHLLNDVFLVEAYSQLPEAAKAAMPATSLKSVMPGDALPVFAEFVDHLKSGDGQGCADAMAELAEFAPAAERLVAAKLKKVIPPPPPPAPPAPPELKRSVPTIQAAFTPPKAAAEEMTFSVPEVPEGVPTWLFAMGLAAAWQQFVARLEARQWDVAWDAAEQLAMQVADKDPEHPELGPLAEMMAMQVAEGLYLDLVLEVQHRLEASDLVPVLAVGGTSLLMGCNDALAMNDWPEALDRLGMMPDDAQLAALVEVISEAAWRWVPPSVMAQATAADLVALWAPGAAAGIRQFLTHLRAGDRRAADEALRGLANVGTSSTKIALMRAKLGWQSVQGVRRF